MSEEKKGIKELLELVAGIKELSFLVKEVLKDKKVSVEDLALLPALLEKQAVLVDAFSGLGEIDDELKDITLDEAMMVIASLVQAAKEFKEA